MGVGRKRLVLLFTLVIVLVVMGSPVKVDAAVDEYKADLFTDSSANWASESNAYDGDWGTYATNPDQADGDDYPSAYANDFDSASSGTGTITQVDIIIRMEVISSSASDEWGITLDVGASTGNVLHALDNQAYSLNNLTFTDVTEPNGGGWSWSEIWAAEVHLDCNRVGGSDNDEWNVYEFAFKITTSPAGIDYTAYPDGDFALGGTTALAASFSKTLVEGFALAGVTALAVAFAVTLVQGFTLVGTTALAASFSKTLAEGFALVGTTSVFLIIQKLIFDGFALTGVVSLAASYVVTLTQGFALAGTTALAASFVVTLVQGVTLADAVSAYKVLIVTLQESFSVVGAITALATSVAGMLFYQLFLSLNMWSYLGPIALVIGGYFVARKNVNLGIIWFMVECLIVAQYFALLEATPDYWWHIFLILIGGLFTCVYPLWGNKK